MIKEKIEIRYDKNNHIKKIDMNRPKIFIHSNDIINENNEIEPQFIISLNYRIYKTEKMIRDIDNQLSILKERLERDISEFNEIYDPFDLDQFIILSKESYRLKDELRDLERRKRRLPR